jgi:FKBP-type peptidyl-prolyl cis-trans isomerase FkpA
MKTRKYKFAIFLFSLPFFLLSCGEEKTPPPQKQLTQKQVNQLSEQMHAWDQRRQRDEINQYIKSHHLEMQQTATGLSYMLMEKGKGELATAGQTVNVSYKIYLLDGTVCYSSETDGPKDVLIGQDNVEAGLHEGLQLMHVGDKMMFILPSQLAHGLTGDNAKIPALASVVFEVELNSITKKANDAP